MAVSIEEAREEINKDIARLRTTLNEIEQLADAEVPEINQMKRLRQRVRKFAGDIACSLDVDDATNKGLYDAVALRNEELARRMMGK